MLLRCDTYERTKYGTEMIQAFCIQILSVADGRDKASAQFGRLLVFMPHAQHSTTHTLDYEILRIHLWEEKKIDFKLQSFSLFFLISFSDKRNQKSYGIPCTQTEMQNSIQSLACAPAVHSNRIGIRSNGTFGFTKLENVFESWLNRCECAHLSSTAHTHTHAHTQSVRVRVH